MIGLLLNDRYRLDTELGQGGMGVVYRARDILLERDVAIKVLSSAAFGTEGRSRLLREARLVARLNHPNIVLVFDAGETDLPGSDVPAPFIVMELLEGVTLHERGTPGLDEAVDIASQVCAALNHAHAHGIIHRDLKPENILLLPDGTAKLMDFGLARAGASRLSEAGNIIGTIFYLAPELALGQEFDGRADLYALGVMLYELTIGELPFTADDPLAVISQHLHSSVPSPRARNPELSPILDALIVKLLSKDPGERPASAADVGKTLDHLGLDSPPSAFRALKTVQGSINNLPHQTTSFIGRQDELQALDALLANPDIRLVSLVGPGGMGKTRLALAVAKQQLAALTADDGALTPRFPDGAFFIPLAPLNAVESLVGATAEGLGVHLERGVTGTTSGEGVDRTPRAQLLDYLRAKRLLLVLDNFEHLLDGAGLVAEILEVASGVRVIATSRERLRLQGEHTFSLQGMQYPQESLVMKDLPIDEYPAMELFIQRARKHRPDFVLQEGELGEIAEICRLTGGMPLAIELAAAWVDMLSLKVIKTELQGSLDFLKTDLRDVPKRHRSMRAVLEATWARLSEEERQIFRYLSVFRGGFTREAAGMVTGTGLLTLTALAEKSLIRYSRRQERFEVHELLRQYGAEKLAEDSAEELEVRDRHGDYYCSFLGAREDDLKGKMQLAAQREIEKEFDNILEAWGWVLNQGNHRCIHQAVVSLGLYMERTLGDEEGRAVFRQAITLFESGSQDEEILSYIRVVPWWTRFVWGDQREEAESRLGKVLKKLDEARFKDIDLGAERASILFALGAWQTDFYKMLSLYEQALTLFKKVGFQYEIAHLHLAIGVLNQGQGRLPEARANLDIALEYLEALGDELGMAFCYRRLGNIDTLEGKPEVGETWFRQAINVSEKFGHQSRIPFDMYYLAFNLSFQGKFVEAVSNVQEGLAISREMGLPDKSGYPYNMLAYCYLSLGKYDQAIANAGLAHQKELELDASWGIAISKLYLGQTETALGRIPEAREHIEESLSIFQETGQPIGTPDALATLAWIYMQLGETSEMKQKLRSALELSLETRVFIGLAITLAVLAIWCVRQGEIATGIEYYSLASVYPAARKSRWFYDIFGRHIDAAAEGLPPDLRVAAETRGLARNSWKTAQDLLDELK